MSPLHIYTSFLRVRQAEVWNGTPTCLRVETETLTPERISEAIRCHPIVRQSNIVKHHRILLSSNSTTIDIYYHSSKAEESTNIDCTTPSERKFLLKPCSGHAGDVVKSGCLCRDAAQLRDVLRVCISLPGHPAPSQCAGSLGDPQNDNSTTLEISRDFRHFQTMSMHFLVLNSKAGIHESKRSVEKIHTFSHQSGSRILSSDLSCSKTCRLETCGARHPLRPRIAFLFEVLKIVSAISYDLLSNFQAQRV